MLSVGNTAFLGDAPMTVQEYMTGLGFAFITGGVINGVAAEAKDLKFSNGGLKEPQAQTGISGTSAQTNGTKGGSGNKKSLYHYTNDETADKIMNSQLGISPESEVYLTPKGDLTPLQAQIELALPNTNTATTVIEVSSEAINPENIVRSGNVTGNVFGKGGGGVEVIYRGQINKDLLNAKPNVIR